MVRQPPPLVARVDFAVALTIASRMVSRRALLGAGLAGGAALLTGCGPDEIPATRPADVLSEQLRVTQLVVAAYAGVDAARAGARAPGSYKKKRTHQTHAPSAFGGES
jgi:hypothetical protein